MRRSYVYPFVCFIAVLLLLERPEGKNHGEAGREEKQEADMALIEAGTFEMGTDASELEGLRRVFGMKSKRVFTPEIPRHTVRVDAFYWEYCADEWQETYYSSSPKSNPVSGNSLFLDDAFLRVSTRRVIRGGSWGGSPVNLRVAYRDSHPPEGAGAHVGFRCVRPIERHRKPD